jgi:molybdenum cofactor synthesis domain-containing protein
LTINVAVLTVSDRSYAGEREDLSGPTLCQIIQKLGWNLVTTSIVPDEFDQIKRFMIEQATSGIVNLILTTGGTGFSPRDVTPEATLALIEKRTPGLVEKIRFESSKTNPHAILSRAEAGIYQHCLILNLPGNPTGAVESLLIVVPVIPHALALLQQSSEAENHQTKID